jgi:hypothetical protein
VSPYAPIRKVAEVDADLLGGEEEVVPDLQGFGYDLDDDSLEVGLGNWARDGVAPFPLSSPETVSPSVDTPLSASEAGPCGATPSPFLAPRSTSVHSTVHGSRNSSVLSSVSPASRTGSAVEAQSNVSESFAASLNELAIVQSQHQRWAYRMMNQPGPLGGIKEKELLAGFPDFPLFEALQYEANLHFDMYHTPRPTVVDPAKVDLGFLNLLRQKGASPLIHVIIEKGEE